MGIRENPQEGRKEWLLEKFVTKAKRKSPDFRIQNREKA